MSVVRPFAALAATLLALLLAALPGRAQNLIVEDGWQGFAIRSADGKFDRCVLYNRTIAALNASPYDMLGVTRDREGNLGLMVFFEPGAFARARQQPVSLKVDQQPPVAMTGDVVSDFHVVITGPFDAPVLAALRQSTSIEVTVEGKSARIAVAGVNKVLDRLAQCVTTYAH